MAHLVQNALVHLQCTSTKKNVRILRDGATDALGGTGKRATFLVHRPTPVSVKFQNVGDPLRWLAIKRDDVLVGTGKGGPFCEFLIQNVPPRFVCFAAKFSPAWHVGYTPDGAAKKPSATGTGNHARYVVIPAAGHHAPHAPAVPAVPAAACPPPPVPGLFILKALYGDLNHNNCADVTRQLLPYVRPSGHVELGPRYNAVLGDPAYGTAKGLLVVYRVGEQRFMKLFNENEQGGVLDNTGAPL